MALPDRVFLGVDHPTIEVEDTQASLRFFRDTLGLRVLGKRKSYGTQQGGPMVPAGRPNVLKRADPLGHPTLTQLYYKLPTSQTMLQLSGLVTIPTLDLEFSRGLMVLDPTGRTLKFVKP